MSDDGECALVVIALLGSPFSPAYARARRGDPKRTIDPLDFSAVNVCLRRGRQSDWALTERTAQSVSRDRGQLAIGDSSMRWEHDQLVIEIRERTSPWRSPLRGRVVFRPTIFGTSTPIAIDRNGSHLWQPVAPLGRAEVRFDEPGCTFHGAAYFDTNVGDEPLEDAFSSWSWSRLSESSGTRITYDVETRDGRALRHGMTLNEKETRTFSGSTTRSLRPTSFGLPRIVRGHPAEQTRLVRTLENGPFYARSEIEMLRSGAGPLRGVHETISLDRLASRWVQFLIPFRARREA